VLVLVLARLQTLGARFHGEEAGSVRRLGQDGIELRHTAVGDELLGAVDAIAGDVALVVGDPIGNRLQRRHVGTRGRLGHAVGHDQALAGDAAQPVLLLFVGAAHDDRIGAQGDGQESRGHAQVDGRHLFRDPADIHGAAAQAAHALRQEDQMQAHVRRQQFAYEVHGKFIIMVKLQEFLVG
jgi:hypothetical protein